MGLTLAHLNGDGRPDLAVPDFGQDNVSVLLNVSPASSRVAPGASIPAFRLAAARPNPSRGPILLDFSLPAAARARMAVYDAEGRLIRTVLDGALGSGAHSLTWDARNDRGERVPAGVYYYELRAPGHTIGRPLVILR